MSGISLATKGVIERFRPAADVGGPPGEHVRRPLKKVVEDFRVFFEIPHLVTAAFRTQVTILERKAVGVPILFSSWTKTIDTIGVGLPKLAYEPVNVEITVPTLRIETLVARLVEPPISSIVKAETVEEHQEVETDHTGSSVETETGDEQ